ncbi:MAG: ribonuclease P protein component [Immundisolibacteraceae bacterium]|nr:ribonuclease P protein component [Immundisolibacteraceae bacterium]
MSVDRTFNPNYRLLHQADFKRVFDDATRIIVPPFTLLFRQNNFDCARLGMVISKKAVGHSVARNRIRRIIRENFRLARLALPKIDLIILARRDIQQFPVSQLNQKITEIWHRLDHG